MFHGRNKNKLVSLLRSRGVFLYHACQLQDLLTYFDLGGVPSRRKIENASLAITPFQSDRVDRVNRVWDKVFLNLEDYGSAFASGSTAVPNVYGPFLIRIFPEALLAAEDVAICLRSAASKGFNRSAESLTTLDQVDRLFYYPASHPYGSAALKFRRALQAEFGSGARAIEVSCSYSAEVLPRESIRDIVVDPYIICGAPLTEDAANVAFTYGLDIRVLRRSSSIEANDYSQLLQFIQSGNLNPAQIAMHSTSPHLAEWGKHIQHRGGLLLRNFRRYAEYLRIGTLIPLEKQQSLSIQTRKPTKVEIAEPNPLEVLTDQEYADYDDELDLLLQDLGEHMEDWARSEEEGWFYADD